MLHIVKKEKVEQTHTKNKTITQSQLKASELNSHFFSSHHNYKNNTDTGFGMAELFTVI